MVYIVLILNYAGLLFTCLWGTQQCYFFFGEVGGARRGIRRQVTGCVRGHLDAAFLRHIENWRTESREVICQNNGTLILNCWKTREEEHIMRYWCGVKTISKSILMKKILGIWTKFMWLVRDRKSARNFC